MMLAKLISGYEPGILSGALTAATKPPLGKLPRITTPRTRPSSDATVEERFSQYMTSRTRWKLNEAIFFLQKLEEHYYDHLQGMFKKEHRPPKFSFYLSAFVGAARSVTWVMRHDYVSVTGWSDWFKNLEATPAQSSLMKLFNDLRVRSVKMEPLPIGQSVRFVGEQDAVTTDPRMPKIRISVTAVDEPAKTVELGEVAAFMWTLGDLDGEDLLPACKEYGAFLSSLVHECEAKFGKRQSYEPIERGHQLPKESER